ncbi:MAG: Lrp/AsnC ligand binding domain-containing protein [Deltaproteobacteria bacterium]|nr:Lrp/AsnC ligand binding domain-containing protein [Deltaproteobacteria bacterium]
MKKAKSAWRARQRPDQAKSFDQDQWREGAFEKIQRGKQRVPLERIVGSVGRYHDFDSRFRPKQHVASERYEDIKKALRAGHQLPPVKLFQIKDEYYVMDGNHRIAAAKALGHQDIEAAIVEFIPSKNILENVLYRQRARFSEKTGLPYNITLTEVGKYDYLLKQVADHHAHLVETRGESVTYAGAAMDWYEHIYRPLLSIIRKGDLLKLFPGRTLDDLYAYISYHQWEETRTRRYGIGIDHLIPDDMEAFREKMVNRFENEYPEMLRKITAFVLFNVRARHERRILEKLFSLKEVREAHSIHGNVDILAKIELKRNLLSSDSEIISGFVHEQLRRIPGVISTQTLIPGQSMIKEQT